MIGVGIGIYHKAQEVCIFVYVMHCVMRLTFVQVQCTLGVYTGAVGWSALLLGHRPLALLYVVYLYVYIAQEVCIFVYVIQCVMPCIRAILHGKLVL